MAKIPENEFQKEPYVVIRVNKELGSRSFKDAGELLTLIRESLRIQQFQQVRGNCDPVLTGISWCFLI